MDRIKLDFLKKGATPRQGENPTENGEVSHLTDQPEESLVYDILSGKYVRPEEL